MIKKKEEEEKKNIEISHEQRLRKQAEQERTKE